MEAEVPLIESLTDLRGLWRHSELTDDGRLEFRQSTFLFITQDYTVYFGRSTNEKLTPAIINKSWKRVPDENVYPEAPSHITTVTKADSSLFFKGPSMAFYDSLNSGQLAEILLREAEVLEYLASRPHPNIIQYHGCQVYRNRIVTLVLDRHPWTLQTCSCDIDMKSGFNEIMSAAKHLHSLGLAHNDITTSNIMISESKSWILIDFGSCRPFGDKLIVAGNPEWTTSSKQNDEAALHKLWCWLFGEPEKRS